MKLNKKSGFTLIEIMIVIVIISLLAVTLVPKLTGAQARSRDASRTASLLSMKAVLTVYYDDFSQFPLNTHTSGDGNGCLSSDSEGSTTVLEDYVESGKNAKDPQKTAKVANCPTTGSFSYNALSKNGSNASAFVLAAQTETYQKSNTKYTDGTTIDADGSKDITTVVGSGQPMDNTLDIAGLKTADDNAAISTIYVVTGG